MKLLETLKYKPFDGIVSGAITQIRIKDTINHVSQNVFVPFEQRDGFPIVKYSKSNQVLFEVGMKIHLGSLSDKCPVYYLKHRDGVALAHRDVPQPLIEYPNSTYENVARFQSPTHWQTVLSQTGFSPLEIVVLDINHQEQLWKIEHADCLAQGFANRTEFRDYWIELHGKDSWYEHSPTWVIDFALVTNRGN